MNTKILNLFTICALAIMISCGGGEEENLCDESLIAASMNCGLSPVAEVDQQNETDIQAYLSANSLTSQKLDNGLHYVIEVQGDATPPNVCDNVNLHYHGTFLDGVVFDSSVDRNERINFILGNLICGWQVGLPKIGTGGKIKLLVPARLAYGYSDFQQIPGGSVLIFDIELFEIN